MYRELTADEAEALGLDSTLRTGTGNPHIVTDEVTIPADSNDASELEHAQNLARLIHRAGSALADVSTYWETNGLPGDFSGPDEGYPFAVSLDEVPHQLWAWAEKIVEAHKPPQTVTVTIDLDRLAKYAPQQTALSLLSEAAHNYRTGGAGVVWTDTTANVGTVERAER